MSLHHPFNESTVPCAITCNRSSCMAGLLEAQREETGWLQRLEAGWLRAQGFIDSLGLDSSAPSLPEKLYPEAGWLRAQGFLASWGFSLDSLTTPSQSE